MSSVPRWLAGALAVAAPATAWAAQAGPATPQWLGIVQLGRPELHDPSRWSEDEKKVREVHFDYWQKLTERGPVVLVGRTMDVDSRGHLPANAIGTMIFEAPDRASAEKIMANDPGVLRGLWRYDLRAYRIVLTRPASTKAN